MLALAPTTNGFLLCRLFLQVILTYGMSDTTLLFLKEASRKREFQVSRWRDAHHLSCMSCTLQLHSCCRRHKPGSKHRHHSKMQ